MTATFRVEPIKEIEPELLRDLNVGEATHAVIRTRETRGDIVWSFHNTERNARNAARRWRLREIPTR